jgi:hypothetical protein
MGYYIEVPSNTGKAKLIEELHDGTILARQPDWNEFPDDLAIIVVVDNGLFEAAGYAYSEEEYRAFTRPSDLRPKTFLVMPRDKAEELSGRSRR